MARNVMKHTIHKWGSNILSIHEGLEPPNSLGGVRWLGQMPNFFRKTIWRAPLSRLNFSWYVTHGPASAHDEMGEGYSNCTIHHSEWIKTKRLDLVQFECCNPSQWIQPKKRYGSGARRMLSGWYNPS